MTNEQRYEQGGINLVSTLKLQLMANLTEEVLAVLLLDARLEFLFLKKICSLNLIEGDRARAGYLHQGRKLIHFEFFQESLKANYSFSLVSLSIPLLVLIIQY
ncbi:unnamed protein product, partial [Musa textilis]